MEANRSKRLLEGNGNTARINFYIKNNFDWTYKQNIEHTGSKKSSIILWSGRSE